MAQRNINLRKDEHLVHFHIGLSYVLSPNESRFVLHLMYGNIKKHGRSSYLNQSDFARIMGLNENSFKTCVNNLIRLNLLTKWNNKLGNKVFYVLNDEQYLKLTEVLSATNNLKALIDFCRNTFKRGRSVDSITQQEIRMLKATRIKIDENYPYVWVD